MLPVIGPGVAGIGAEVVKLIVFEFVLVPYEL